MSQRHDTTQGKKTSRREFLRKSTTLAGAAAAASLPLPRGAHAAGSDVIKFGLIGCGGRGCGAALNAMNAGPDVRLVAMADLFHDKAEAGRKRLLASARGEQVAVADDHLFSGFDGYEKVLASDIDVAVIAATSHFHPRMFEAAVKAGKHIFCEKPHALDAPGAKRVAAACEEAKQKKQCVVSGLVNRYNPRVRETVKRIHDGMIGRVTTVHEVYRSSPYCMRERDPSWTELEWQFHNWYHFLWLAGDQCPQQLIHSIDVGAFAMKNEWPVKAWGLGGRSACFGPRYGDLFDHQSVVFEYADGKRMYGLCRNQLGVPNERADLVYGTKGTADIRTGRIEGETNWKYEGENVNPFDVEHQELFAAVRAGNVISNADYMVGSSLMALLAQTVCQTGQEMTWEQIVDSETSVELPRYGWDVEPPVKPNDRGEYDVAIPGITKYA